MAMPCALSGDRNTPTMSCALFGDGNGSLSPPLPMLLSPPLPSLFRPPTLSKSLLLFLLLLTLLLSFHSARDKGMKPAPE